MRNYVLSLLIGLSLVACSSKPANETPPATPAAAEASPAPAYTASTPTPTPEAKPKKKKKKFDQRDYEK